MAPWQAATGVVKSAFLVMAASWQRGDGWNAENLIDEKIVGPESKLTIPIAICLVDFFLI